LLAVFAGTVWRFIFNWPHIIMVVQVGWRRLAVVINFLLMLRHGGLRSWRSSFKTLRLHGHRIVLLSEVNILAEHAVPENVPGAAPVEDPVGHWEHDDEAGDQGEQELRSRIAQLIAAKEFVEGELCKLLHGICWQLNNQLLLVNLVLSERH
jgi:hypothetical protein